MDNKKMLGLGIGAVIVIIIAIWLMPSAQRFGGVTNYSGLAVGSDGLQIGSSGTNMTQVLHGSMNCTGGATVSANSLGTYDCAVTGVVAGDKVFATASSSSPASLSISSTYASSTAGFVRVIFLNASSTAATPATTSIPYYIVR